ncbi:hypothetical protein ACFVWR_05855 [Leifsonia sp. NPDC058292]|uniref:hypothetical protein n=1 Tax=Leifsonia sp. NPDC058292 TaxID=3346428 RepID=UPI0036D78540
MSALAERTTTDTMFDTSVAAPVTWYSPAESLWVASTPTDYVGMVDLNHDGYVATDGEGHELGVFPTAYEAQQAVAAAVTPSSR